MTAEHTLQDMYVQLPINYRERDMSNCLWMPHNEHILTLFIHKYL
jgi:hypothetical protein